MKHLILSIFLILVTPNTQANNICSEYFLPIPESVRAAKNEISRLEDIISASYTKSGFSSRANLIKALEEGDEVTNKIWKTLKNEEVEFAMQAPPSARSKISKSGEFKNKWELMNLDKNGYAVEYIMTGRTRDSYYNVSKKTKPK
jgi:hypothetical protein